MKVSGGPTNVQISYPQCPFSPPTHSCCCSRLNRNHEKIYLPAHRCRAHIACRHAPATAHPLAPSNHPSRSRPLPVALAPPHPSRVDTGIDAGPSSPPPGVGPPTTDAGPPSTTVGHWSPKVFFQVFFEFILNVIKFGRNLSEIDKI
jgi:hypothetical protein